MLLLDTFYKQRHFYEEDIVSIPFFYVEKKYINL